MCPFVNHLRSVFPNAHLQALHTKEVRRVKARETHVNDPKKRETTLAPAPARITCLH